jgi:hypothetical protein
VALAALQQAVAAANAPAGGEGGEGAAAAAEAAASGAAAAKRLKAAKDVVDALEGSEEEEEPGWELPAELQVRGPGAGRAALGSGHAGGVGTGAGCGAGAAAAGAAWLPPGPGRRWYGSRPAHPHHLHLRPQAGVRGRRGRPQVDGHLQAEAAGGPPETAEGEGQVRGVGL